MWRERKEGNYENETRRGRHDHPGANEQRFGTTWLSAFSYAARGQLTMPPITGSVIQAGVRALRKLLICQDYVLDRLGSPDAALLRRDRFGVQ
jgi:hypothetical protein